MREHFKRVTVKIAERFKFFKRAQQDKEEIDEYFTKLRKLGKTCNFGDHLDTALCSYIVCSLKDYKPHAERAIQYERNCH